MGLATLLRPLTRLWAALSRRLAEETEWYDDVMHDGETPPPAPGNPPVRVEAGPSEVVVILQTVASEPAPLSETTNAVHMVEVVADTFPLPAPLAPEPLRHGAELLHQRSPRRTPALPTPGRAEDPQGTAERLAPITHPRPGRSAFPREQGPVRWIKPAPTDGKRGSWDSSRGLWFTGRWTSGQP